MSGSSQSLNLAARLGRFSRFTLKIGQTSGSLTARGEKKNLQFRFESTQAACRPGDESPEFAEIFRSH